MRFVFRLSLLASFAVACWSEPALLAAEGDLFLQQHCFDCHGESKPTAGLKLAGIPSDLNDPATMARWIQVHDRVEKREMPPKDAEQPRDPERAAFLKSLRGRLVQADREQLARRGNGAVRRLNRVEYEHTLQDLLALPLLRVKELLPEDGRQQGFDKVAGALDISHIQMTKYLQAADVALRQAIVRDVKAPETKTWREPAATQYSAQAAIAIHCGVPIVRQVSDLPGKSHDERTGQVGNLSHGLTTHVVGNPDKDYGNTYRAATFKGDADSVALLTGVLGAHQPEGLQIDRFKPVVGGWYRVKFSVWGLRWERTKAAPAKRGTVRQFTTFGPPYFQDDAGKWNFTRLPDANAGRDWLENVEFYGDGEATHVVRASLKGKPLGFYDAPSLKPTMHEFKVWLNPGERVSFHAMTLPASGASNSGVSNGVVDYEGPAVAFDWFEVEGPLVDQWPPESQRRLFGETPIGAYPRPLQAGVPTVEPDKLVKVAVADWKGAGQTLGTERLLNLAGKTTTKINCSTAGEYEVAVTAYETHAGDEPAKMWLLIDGREMPHARFAVDVPRASPKTYRAKFKLESAGPAEIGIEFVNDFFDEKHPDPSLRDRNLFVTNVEVRRTGFQPVPPAATAAATDVSNTGWQPVLRRFAELAFRRPVETSDVAPYVAIVVERLSRAASFEESMLAGYKAILCSPDFLFVEIEPANYALASRLSYFLWDSMPDDTLLALAKSGELSQPKTLRSQVERMLNDPRSERFVEHFLDEWLEMSKIDFTTPDPQLYPEFDAWLRDSMLAETRAYFRKLLTEDRGVEHLVASDFLLVNQRLAELYGIRGVNGSQLREMPVPAGSKRGGLLTQAAVLKVTANGTATSPVLRGVWVIERLLGIPRQPPPPNIPAIEPDATGAVTIRQMIEQHRADAVCASCHAKMDPPGMALESFDVIGGLRDRYRLSGQPQKIRRGNETIEEPSLEIVSGAAYRNRVKLRLGSEVDASGELADGRKFTDIDGLRKLLLVNRDQLARNLVQQLTIYATGRVPRFSDRDEIEAIITRSRGHKHGLRSLIHEVVASKMFHSENDFAPP